MPEFVVRVTVAGTVDPPAPAIVRSYAIQAASYALAAAKALDQGVKMPKGAVVHLRIQRVEGT